MSGRTKPAKQRRHWGKVNTLAHVCTHAGLLRPDEIERIMAAKHTALAQARTAQLTEAGYYALTTAVIIARAIEDRGPVRGLEAQIAAAWNVLTIIGRSMDQPGGWKPHALHGPQIDALDTLVWLHGEQLKNLQYNEWQQVQRLAGQRTRTAGGKVVVANGENHA